MTEEQRTFTQADIDRIVRERVAGKDAIASKRGEHNE
jgi:hypothetical protein